jgi:hypothetical protein
MVALACIVATAWSPKFEISFAILVPYEILMTALVEVSAGKVIVNVPLAVLSLPKFNTATAAPVVELYINAPRVTKLAPDQVTVLNDKYDVLLVVLPSGVMGVKTFPPAVYPVPTTSLTELYAVVVLSKLASAVYKAIL